MKPIAQPSFCVLTTTTKLPVARWHDASAQIARPDGVEVATLLASDVLREHDPDLAAALSERDRLPRDLLSDPDDR